jgi:DNA mismatch repair protein MutL
MDALGQGGVPELQLRPPEAVDRAPITMSIPGVFGGGSFPSRWIPPDATLQQHGADLRSDAGRPAPPIGEAAAGAETDIRLGPDRESVSPMIPLGQFRDTFIIAIDVEGIAIIDQHVAHERVLFERVMERLSAGRLESQRLLVPLMIELPAGVHQTLVSRASDLDRFGFELEGFGDNTIKVTAVPALLKAEDSSKALLALANDLDGLDRGADVQDALRRIAATTACHAAVKANYPLTYEKMVHILEELRATAYSTVCPHGRPVMLRITRREIEKNFERI